MKKIFLFCFCILFSLPVSLLSQNIDRDVRNATRELNRYNLDPLQNAENLNEAISIIESVIQQTEALNHFRAWQTRGEIYNTSLTAQVALMQIGQAESLSRPHEAIMAFESFRVAIPLAERRHETRDALDGITEAAGHLGFVGNIYISQGEYAQAFAPLNAVYEIHKILIENDRDPIFDDKEELNNHIYILGITGLGTDQSELAKSYLMKLYKERFDEPRVYTTLFNLYIQTDEDKALEFLEAGKEVDPENIDILYAEINYYISQQNFPMLQEKLAIAIEKDPENYTLYSVLGNVFMNLMTEAMSEENEEDEEVYFETAKGYLQTAIELEPDFFEPYYTLGSMYFNKAAVLTQRMNELGMSREEQRLYEEYNKQANELFETALPYFQAAESLEPNDPSTLIALRETFARMQDFDMYQEFNERLQRLEAGEKNESSYFNR
jgi:tetratricopeptide (TPR) repeat protein